MRGNRKARHEERTRLRLKHKQRIGRGTASKLAKHRHYPTVAWLAATRPAS